MGSMIVLNKNMDNLKIDENDISDQRPTNRFTDPDPSLSSTPPGTPGPSSTHLRENSPASSKQTFTSTPTRLIQGDNSTKPCIKCGDRMFSKGDACVGCGIPRYLNWNKQSCDFCRSFDHELVDCPNPKRPKACFLCGHGHLRKDCPALGMKGQADIDKVSSQFTPLRYQKYLKTKWKAASSQLAKRPETGDRSVQGTEVVTNFLRISQDDKSKAKPLKFHKYKIHLGEIPGLSAKSPAALRSPNGRKGSQNSARPVDHIMRREMILGLLKANRPTESCCYATNYQSTIISIGELYKKGVKPLDKNNHFTTTHKFLFEDGGIKKYLTIKSTIEFVGYVNFDDLIDYPKGENVLEGSNLNHMASALNVIISKEIKDSCSNLSVIPTSPRRDMDQLIKAYDDRTSWRMSISPVEGSLLLRIHKQNPGSKTPQESYDETIRYTNSWLGQGRRVKSCSGFGLKIDQALLPLSAMMLEAPVLQRNLKKIVISTLLPVISLQVTDPKNPRIGKDIVELEKVGIDSLITKLNAIGPGRVKSEYQVANLPVADKFTNSYKNAIIHSLNEATRKMKSISNSVVILVLPKNDPVIYSCIKFWGDCIVGIKTLCFLRKNIDGSNELKTAKFIKSISAKVSSKLDGMDYTIERRKNFNAVTANSMIVGAYLSRGSSHRCPSIAGVVATCGLSSMVYLASARLQVGIQEYIEDLSGMIKERVVVWFNKSKQLPKEILMYRGGISEGQFGMVKCAEVVQLTRGFRDAVDLLISLKKLSPAKTYPLPKVTVVAVVKHQNTRFYKLSDDSGIKTPKKVHNAPPGLVVDATIVDRRRFNFYLQSHASVNVTPKIAHYTVIENGMNFTESELQSLTYDLCFSESQIIYRKMDDKGIRRNAVKDGMSTCMPARYAEYLCDRARCYIRPALHQDPDPKKHAASKMSAYERAKQIWSYHGDRQRHNPWDKNMDDTMFYV